VQRKPGTFDHRPSELLTADGLVEVGIGPRLERMSCDLQSHDAATDHRAERTVEA